MRLIYIKMALVLSILALIIGLLAVYLAADSRQGVEEKIRKFTESYAKATDKNLDDCISSLNILSERIEKIESDTEDFPEFKAEVTAELASINKKMSDIRQELVIKYAAPP